MQDIHISFDKNDIPSFFVNFAAHFDKVVHKQIVIRYRAGAATSQHGGQHIMRFGLEGCELSDINCY